MFKDRADAGKQLAQLVTQYKNNSDVVVIGLPRGGIVTAYEVAVALNAPLDIIVTRKISTPTNPELAVGALTQEGEIVWNKTLLKSLDLTEADFAPVIEEQQAEAVRRLHVYRGDRKPLNLKDKIVILVDDGIATGATMSAAIISVRAQGAKKIVVAAPVAPTEVIVKMKKEADEVVCVMAPQVFFGIGEFYNNFEQIEDTQVVELLEKL